MTSVEAKVRVRFITQCQKYAVADTPFAVPSKLARSGLSKVINHLLRSLSGHDDEDEEAEDISFDFLLEGHLIRMTLDKLVSKMNLSTEDVITIEYFPAVTVDKGGMQTSEESPAWISCVDTRSSESEVVVGCYDGTIRVVSTVTNSMQDLSVAGATATATAAHHEGPITDICSFLHLNVHNNASSDVVISCGKDHTVKCYARNRSVSASNNGKTKKGGNSNSNGDNRFKQVALFDGHLSSVQCVDAYLQCVSDSQPGCSNATVVSGDWSGNIFGWNDLNAVLEGYSSNTAAAAAAPTSSSVSSKKKMKLNDESGIDSSAVPGITQVRTMVPSFRIHAHSQAVSDVQLYSSAATTNSAAGGSPLQCTHMVSASWDHSLKIWDIARQDNIKTFNTGRVITSLHYSAVNRMILVSHPDGKIRLYDNRNPGGAAAATTSSEEDNQDSLNANTCMKVFGNSSTASNATPQWISQVRWHPTAAHLFASTDYDGAVKLWDTRTLNVPLRTIKDVHEGKGLCLDWLLHSSTDASIVSGGSDCCVRNLRVADIDDNVTVKSAIAGSSMSSVGTALDS